METVQTYFATNSINNLVKIGKTTQPKIREKGMAGQITFIQTKIQLLIDGNYETMLKRHFKPFWDSGEWFNIAIPTKEEVFEIIEKGKEAHKASLKYSDESLTMSPERVLSKVLIDKLRRQYDLTKSAVKIVEYIYLHFKRDEFLYLNRGTHLMYLWIPKILFYAQISEKSLRRAFRVLESKEIIKKSDCPLIYSINLSFLGEEWDMLDT